jgi:hypothetical protein
MPFGSPLLTSGVSKCKSKEFFDSQRQKKRYQSFHQVETSGVGTNSQFFLNGFDSMSMAKKSVTLVDSNGQSPTKLDIVERQKKKSNSSSRKKFKSKLKNK